MARRRIRKGGSRFEHPDHPLSDDEIQERYGDLLLRAQAAFREDSDYLVDMATTANRLAEKRAKRLPEEAPGGPRTDSDPPTRTSTT